MSIAPGRVVITEATDDDAAGFAQFFDSAWREAGPGAAGFTGATDEVIAELTTPEAFRKRIAGPDRHMFLARDVDRVVGFSSTRRVSEDLVELSGIIVLRSHGGLGIGRALIDSATAAAKKDGYRTMVVKTETTNARAQALYESSGFEVEGTETELEDGVPIGLLRLSRPI